MATDYYLVCDSCRHLDSVARRIVGSYEIKSDNKSLTCFIIWHGIQNCEGTLQFLSEHQLSNEQFDYTDDFKLYENTYNEIIMEDLH